MAVILGSGATASGLSLSLLTASKAWAEAGDSASSGDELASIARQLYPHDVADSVYAGVVDSILSAAASDPQLQKSLDQAISELNAATGGDFLTAGDNLQLVAMKGMDQQPWFAAIQGQVLPPPLQQPGDLGTHRLSGFIGRIRGLQRPRI